MHVSDCCVFWCALSCFLATIHYSCAAELLSVRVAAVCASADVVPCSMLCRF